MLAVYSLLVPTFYVGTAVRTLRVHQSKRLLCYFLLIPNC